MTFSRILFLAAVACSLALPLLAQETPVIYRDDCEAVESTVVAMPAPEAGIWIFTDDDTGALRRQVAEEQAKSGSLNWSSAGLTLVIHPDGSKSVDLEDRFMTDFVIRLDDSGHPVASCIDGPQSIMAAPAKPAFEEK
jgi:hypothetical protein